MKLKKALCVIMILTTVFTLGFNLNASKSLASNTIDSDYCIEKYQVLCEQLADVNGDGIAEKIILSANYQIYFGCLKGFKLCVKNIETDEIISEQEIFKGQEGISPSLTIGDINNDGKSEILVLLTTGMQKGLFVWNIYSLSQDNNFEEISITLVSDNSYMKYEVIKEDKVQITIDGIETQFLAPLSQFQELLYKNMKDGKFKDHSELFYFLTSNVYFKDIDNDGIDELIAEKFFCPYLHSDACKMEIAYKFVDSEWQIVSARGYALEKERAEEDKTKQNITDADLCMGKLKIGQTYKQVLKILGLPDTEFREKVSNKLIPISLSYDGYLVYIGFSTKGFLNYISMSSGKLSESYHTSRGLKIGDPVEKVIALYGSCGDCGDSNDHYLQYFSADLKSALEIVISDNKVTNIIIRNDLSF